jgi:endonuclease/exonuclease/phosphatase (EEP) superfamily protein YafD
VYGGQRATAKAATSIDIVALNVNYRNDGFARVAGYLRERDPDIIVIAEYTPAWRDELEFLRKSHPYQFGEVRPDPWGLAVFSRLPFMESELIDLADTDTVHARFVFAAGMMSLEVFAVHLLPPKSAVWARNRNLQLENLVDQLGASTHQRIVIGDLNLTPFSPYFSRFIERTGLQDARRVDGFHVTWPVSVFPVWIPIDHALADPEVNITSVHAGPDVGSDHFPLEIRVSKGVNKQPGQVRAVFE